MVTWEATIKERGYKYMEKVSGIFYKEIQRLENELAWYKKEYESLKQKLEVK